MSASPPRSRRKPNDGGLATRLAAELAPRSPRAGTAADDRAQLVADQRRRRRERDLDSGDTGVSPAPEPEPEKRITASGREMHERRRLLGMLKAREKHGEASHYTPERVELQRALIRQLAAEPATDEPQPRPLPPRGGRGVGSLVNSPSSSGREGRDAAQRIVWLPEPVTLYEGSRIRVVGYDASMLTWPPAWLRADGAEAA